MSSTSLPSTINPARLDIHRETETASRLMLLKPKSFLGKFQNGAAKRMLRECETAVGAERAAEQVALMPVEEMAPQVRRSDDASEATTVKAAIEVKAKTVSTFTLKSMTAEERVRFAMRQAALAQYLRTEADFSYLDDLSEEEKNLLSDLRQRRRDACRLPKKQQAASIAAIIDEYGAFRGTVINRLAQSAEATDAALKNVGAAS